MTSYVRGWLLTDGISVIAYTVLTRRFDGFTKIIHDDYDGGQ